MTDTPTGLRVLPGLLLGIFLAQAMGLGFWGTVAATVAGLAVWGAVTAIWKRSTAEALAEADKGDFYLANFESPQHVKTPVNLAGPFLLDSQSVWMRVTAKRPVALSEFSVRFVTVAVGTNADDPLRSVVSVEDVSHQSTRPSPHFRCVGDRFNGQEVYLEKAFERGPDDPLWLHVSVSAKQSWRGYLSFRANNDRGLRCCARLPVEFRSNL